MLLHYMTRQSTPLWRLYVLTYQKQVKLAYNSLYLSQFENSLKFGEVDSSQEWFHDVQIRNIRKKNIGTRLCRHCSQYHPSEQRHDRYIFKWIATNLDGSCWISQVFERNNSTLQVWSGHNKRKCQRKEKPLKQLAKQK